MVYIHIHTYICDIVLCPLQYIEYISKYIKSIYV